MKFHKSFLLLVFSAVCCRLPCRASAASAENAKTAENAETPKKSLSQSKDDYYELYKLLADTVDQVDRNYVKEVDRRELIEAAIRGVMNKLDPYSAYIGPEELAQFRSSVDNEFGGIGIHVSIDDGDLKVLSPIYGTPAYRAGIQAGDRIVEIEGKSTDGIQPDDAIRWMKGAEGTKVSITVVHAGKTKREKFTLTRERVHVETVLGDRRKADDHWEFMYDEKSQIGYIRISAFSQETAKELRTALEDLKRRNVRGLVLDLRFNPGGLLRSAIEVSNLFISSGRIVSTKGRNTPERVWDAHGSADFRRRSDGDPRESLQRQRQRDRVGLSSGPQAGRGHGRADLGQGQRAEYHRTGERPQRPETDHGRLQAAQRQEYPPLPGFQG